VAATAVATALCLSLTGGPPAAADPREEPDAAALQQSTREVRNLLRTAGNRLNRTTEVPPPPRGTDHGSAERLGRPPVRVLVDGQPPALHSAADCAVPTFADARFADFDHEVNGMLSEWGIGAATLAVANECGTIYDQGYGRVGPWWVRNATGNSPGGVLGPDTPDDALFRVASIVKPITAAAIHDLDERDLLAKTDRAFCVPGGSAPCHLTVPLPANFDPRIGDITIADLVLHRGGFNRTKTVEYLFRAWETYQARNLSAPPTPRDFTAHMLAMGLDEDPGSVTSYANLGYLILGLIIEKLSGQTYRDYVYQRLLAPLGIPAADVILSRGKRSTRDPREVGYWCIDKKWKGYDPISTYPGEEGERRCWANGGWVHESMAAHGGLSMTASSLATFYAHWWNFGNPRTADTYWNFPAGTKVAYSHTGLLESTSTVAARCVNGLNVTLLTNQHAWGKFDFAAAEKRICAAADRFLAQGPYYSSIWVRDSGSAWASHRATPAAAYQNLVTGLKADGYRLLDVNGYRTGGATYYASAWVKDTAGWAATHGDDFAGFAAKFDQYKATGYRMDKVSGWNDDGVPRYASVWVPNPAGTPWISHVRMTTAQYQKLAEQYDKAGYRLLSVDGYGARIAAVWLHDPTTRYRAVHGRSGAAYQAFLEKAVADGYRLTDKDVYQVGTKVRFAAIATRQAGLPFRSFSTWNFYTYQPSWSAQKAAGFRPVSISAYR
jgi:CubicO group peptidase (beta-lactamase class C family)